MFEMLFSASSVVVSAFIAYHLGHIVAESRHRHAVIAVVAIALAGVAGASHLVVNGFPFAVLLVALVAGEIGRAKARRSAIIALRQEDNDRQLLHNIDKATTPKEV